MGLIREVSYTNKKEILAIPDHYVAIPVTIDSSVLVADAEGKKIMKAGTIIGGVLADPTQKAVSKNTVELGATAEGVLLNDVDCTNGDGIGAMVIHGFFDKAKVTENVEAPVAEAITALASRIMFI